MTSVTLHFDGEKDRKHTIKMVVPPSWAAQYDLGVEQSVAVGGRPLAPNTRAAVHLA